MQQGQFPLHSESLQGYPEQDMGYTRFTGELETRWHCYLIHRTALRAGRRLEFLRTCHDHHPKFYDHGDHRCGDRSFDSQSGRSGLTGQGYFGSGLILLSVVLLLFGGSFFPTTDWFSRWCGRFINL